MHVWKALTLLWSGLLLGVGSAWVAGLGLVGSAAAPEAKAVRIIRNLAYYEGPDADPVRHRLDLYLPAGKDFPTVLFIHGGAWRVGDKNQLGLYGQLGRRLARHGIALVAINYRLSPAVQHPEHIKDVARAFAWTYRHIRTYGGRPEELFVAGHSAGGHLTALLATDRRYLQAQGLSLKAIRGAIPMSGIFLLPPLPALQEVFGDDPAQVREASPLYHVTSEAPPFLILYADHDLPGCDGPQAEDFARALRRQGVAAETMQVRERNHISLLVLGTREEDPVFCRLLGFITARVTLQRLAVEGGTGLEFLNCRLCD